jgi:enoyl-CoA hydratase
MAGGQYQYIKYEDEGGGVASVTLNRPDKLNAFNLPMYEEICNALAAAEEDESVRVVVLKGEGRAFCAGRDFTYSAELQDEEAPDAWRRRYKLFARWTLANNKMVICLVQGYALGGGGTLALGCDITIAAESAKFGYPETRHGIASKTMLWAWFLGPKVAMEIVATGRHITAERGQKYGLVNRVVPADQLVTEGLRIAREIAAMPYGVPELIKRQVNASRSDFIRMSVHDRMFDLETAHWDAAGVEPSPWMLSAEATVKRSLMLDAQAPANR